MENIKKQIAYWTISAEKNFKTAQDIFKIKHYDSCLFFCHLTLEKILKAIIVHKTKQSAPYLHDLERLIFLAGIDIDEKQRQILRTISTFNIAVRYDDYKLSFYKQCTKSYGEKYLLITKELYLWLKKFLKK